MIKNFFLPDLFLFLNTSSYGILNISGRKLHQFSDKQKQYNKRMKGAFPMSQVDELNRPPLRENIVTVAMPGVTSTRSQLARYAGEEGLEVLQNLRPKRNINSLYSAWRLLGNSLFCADDNWRYNFHEAHESEIEMGGDDDFIFIGPLLYHARSRIAPRILHNIFPCPEVREISNKCSWHPLHWVMLAKEMATRWLFATRLSRWCFCYCEAGGSGVGGTADQSDFRRDIGRAVDYIQQQPQKKHLVLFGCSRGATTCFYSSMKLPKVLASAVSLVIVEAPFDTMDNVINASCWFPKLMRWLFRYFCDYRGEEDARNAYSFDSEEVYLQCPVAFVVSVRDGRVPNSCTQALIERVKRELVPHRVPAVEVLVLKHSRHPTMAVGCKEDQSAYVRFVEGLYSKYCP